MKKLLVILVFGLSAIVAQANDRSTHLDLRILDRGLFTVQFDHLILNEPSKNFLIQDIKPGRHLLKVRHAGSAHRGGRGHKSVHGHGHGHGHGHKQRGQLIFWGYVDINSRGVVHAEIDNRHRFRITHTKGHPVGYGQFVGYGNTGGYGSTFEQQRHRMSNEEMFNVINRIDAEWFEKDKKRVAKRAIEKHGLSSAQLREILNRFDFEDTRLELAKFGFHHVVDPDHFYRVFDVFHFESSKHELEHFIRI